MKLFTRPTHDKPEDRDRDRKNEEAQTILNDFFSDMRETLKELQETSRPDRKDFPLASALKRSTQP